MPNYRRDYTGTVWFFTVVTAGRRPLFASDEARRCLRLAVTEARGRYPFAIDAWVLLQEHLHCVWTLPEDDTDYSRRWSLLKRRFTQQYRDVATEVPPFWQDRFWAHRIEDERDYENHLNYVHYNPVKHGHAAAPLAWEWSTFRRHVESGTYPEDWGAGVTIPSDVGSE